MTTEMLRTLPRIDTARFAALNAVAPKPTVSERYSFIPTTRVLDVLDECGWYPTSVMEKTSKRHAGYQLHSVRLSNAEFQHEWRVGTTLPQLVLQNDHSGSTRFTLQIGLHELRCTNGLMVALPGASEYISLQHKNIDPAVLDALLREVADRFSDVMPRVEEFRRLQMTEAARAAYARDAIALRWDGSAYAADAPKLLVARREEEQEPTLWNTYNVVQEYLIRGGIDRTSKTGRKLTARPVNAILEDQRINKALWTLTEDYAKNLN